MRLAHTSRSASRTAHSPVDPRGLRDLEYWRYVGAFWHAPEAEALDRVRSRLGRCCVVRQTTAASTGTSRSSVSIVFGYGKISTLVIPTDVKPARVSAIWSVEPVIASANPTA